MSLLITGVVAFDYVETPFGKSEKMMGGPAIFSALAASYFDIKSDIVSIVGHDFTTEHFKKLEERKISTQNIQVNSNEKTFYWAGRYHENMNNRDTLATDLNVYENYMPLVDKRIEPSIVMLGNDHPTNQLTILNQLAKKPDLIVLDTMNYWMDNNWEEVLKVIQKIDVLTINDSEAQQLSAEHSLVKAAKKILKMGPRFLIIKKGEHGALLFDKNEKMFFAPALPLEEVFDPTGAGDTFAGGFVGYLTKTNDFSFENMKRAVIHGSILASFCVQKFGTDMLFEITSDDMYKRIELFRSLMECDF